MTMGAGLKAVPRAQTAQFSAMKEPLKLVEGSLLATSHARMADGERALGATDGTHSQTHAKSTTSRYDDMSPHELGIEGERVAEGYLLRQGYEVIARNWVCPCGEADLICRDGNDHVLVEVKARLQRPGIFESLPELAVNAAKRRRYRGIAQCYLASHEVDQIRCDVVAVSFVAADTVKVHHIVDAFGGEQ